MKIFSPIPPERKQWGGGGSDPKGGGQTENTK